MATAASGGQRRDVTERRHAVGGRMDVDARHAHEPSVLAQADVPARLEAPLVEPRARVRDGVQRLDVCRGRRA